MRDKYNYRAAKVWGMGGDPVLLRHYGSHGLGEIIGPHLHDGYPFLEAFVGQNRCADGEVGNVGQYFGGDGGRDFGLFRGPVAEARPDSVGYGGYVQPVHEGGKPGGI